MVTALSTGMNAETNTMQHPFQRTLGDGPYKIVGFFYIDVKAGQTGRPYYNAHEAHPRFVRGAGTCAHCGTAILNVCQVEIGNGDVYGIGMDCVAKVALPVKEMTKLLREKSRHAKAQRNARKSKKGAEAREKLQVIIEAEAAKLSALPHPTEYLAKSRGLTLKDYAEFMVKTANDNGIVYGLGTVIVKLKGQGEA